MAMTTFVTDSGSNLTTPSVGGHADKYAAGNINYTALGLKAADFQDPTTNQSYKMGVSDYDGGVYELAATVEKDGVATAYVLGNYSPRTATAVNITGSGTTVKLASANDIGKLKAQDLLTTPAVTINAISRDGMTLTLSASASTSLTVPDESKGLIKSTAATETPVEKDTTNIPYSIAN
jgi:hypothetical protein